MKKKFQTTFFKEKTFHENKIEKKLELSVAFNNINNVSL